jgi:hypothetical protein
VVAQAALFDHCTKVYEAMAEQSKPSTTEGFEGEVYSGHLTGLFSDLGLAVPYYSSVMAKLKDMDCVLQLRRGGGSAQSIWAILRPPTEELFEATADKTASPTARKPKVSDMLQQQIRDLDHRLHEAEQTITLLKALLVDKTIVEEGQDVA